MTPAPDGLRLTVALAAAAGVGAIGGCGLVGTDAAAAACLAVLVASLVSRWGPRIIALRWRQSLSAVVLASAGAIAVGATEPKAALAGLAVGLTVASALLLDTVRDHVRMVALAVALAVLAVATDPTPVVGVAFAVVWAAGLTALLLADEAAMPRSVDAVMTAPSSSTRLPLARVAPPVAMAMLVTLAVFLVLPQHSSAAGRFGRAVSTRSPATYSVGALDMRARGDLSGTPLVEVPADAPRLWRGAVYGHYDGTRWLPLPGARRLPVADRYDLAPPGGWTTTRRTYQDAAVRPIERGYSVVVAPGEPVDLRTPSRVRVRGGAVEVGPDPYTVGYWAPPEPRSGTPVGELSRGDFSDYWTVLPPTLPARVRALASDVTRSARTREEAVSAIETYLRTTLTYRLDSPVPRPDEDAVDRFLFVDRVGFCEQFAAAEVVMLRSLGVPARLVTGFTNGEYDGDRRVFRSRDLHAWVEVWYPGSGWVSSDPTPPGQEAASRTGLGARVTAAVERLRASTPARLVTASTLVLLLIAVAGFAARRRRHGDLGTDVRERPPRGIGPLGAAFRRLEVALAAAGSPREPTESLRELASRLPSTAPEHPLSIVERACYAEQAVAPSAALDAVAELDRMSTALLAARE